MLRRNRKRKRESRASEEGSPVAHNLSTSTLTSPATSQPSLGRQGGGSDVEVFNGGSHGASNLQSTLTSDIDWTREQLSTAGDADRGSLGALSTLADACAVLWHDSIDTGVLTRQLFTFQDRRTEWTEGEY